MGKGEPRNVKGQVAADEGEVGGGRISPGGEPSGEVLIEENELTGIEGLEDGGSASGRSVVPRGREPSGVVGVKIAHNDDVAV